MIKYLIFKYFNLTINFEALLFNIQVELCSLLLTLADENRACDVQLNMQPEHEQVQQSNGNCGRNDVKKIFDLELDSVINGVLKPEHDQMQRLLSSPRIPQDQVR